MRSWPRSLAIRRQMRWVRRSCSVGRSSDASPPGSATEPACQKIQFHFLLADLPVKLADQRLAGLLGLARPFVEDRRGAVSQLPLPLSHQRRGKAVLRGALRPRLLSLQPLQRPVRLECRSMIAADLAHRRLSLSRGFEIRSRAKPSVQFLGTSSYCSRRYRAPTWFWSVSATLCQFDCPALFQWSGL